MISWNEPIEVYLHREPVDFRKAINGLSVIVSDDMELSPFEKALYVFCNKRRSHLKVLYLDETGFALSQNRLEKDKFKWPRNGHKSSANLYSLIQTAKANDINPYRYLHEVFTKLPQAQSVELLLP